MNSATKYVVMVGILMLTPLSRADYDVEAVAAEAEVIENEISVAQEQLEGDQNTRYFFNDLQVRGGFEASNRDAQIFSGKIQYAHFVNDIFALGVRYGSYKLSNHRSDAKVITEQRASYELMSQVILGNSVFSLSNKRMYGEWIIRFAYGKTSFSNDQDEDMASLGIDLQLFLKTTISGTFFYEMEASPLWAREKTTYRSLVGIGFGYHF